MRTRISASLILVTLAGVPYLAMTQETKPGGVDTPSLTEVLSLSQLPPGLAVAIGRRKIGLEGIADVQEPFNSTDAVDSRVPLRRFIVGGLSAKSALVAYEQGGPDSRAHPYHAKAYVLEESGWKQTGEWNLDRNPIRLTPLIVQVESAEYLSMRVFQRIARSRPTRRDGPLREANLSDDEVREIQAAAHGVVPDSLVNISGVVTGCPCEEGTNCSDQVWIVAYSPGLTKGLQLSKIGGRWAVGPVQQWWLDLENIDSRQASFASWTAYGKERQKVLDRFPVCASVGLSPGAAKGPLASSGQH